MSTMDVYTSDHAALVRREMDRAIESIKQAVDLMEAHWREATGHPTQSPWAIREVRRLIDGEHFRDLRTVTCQAIYRKRLADRIEYLTALTPRTVWRMRMIPGSVNYVLESRPKESTGRWERRGPSCPSKAHCVAHLASQIKALGIRVDD